MIVGVDHLALSCPALEAGMAALGRLGYRSRFRETRVPNPPQKQPYLAQYGSLHDIALMEVPGSVNIELTSHGADPNERLSPYHVLMDEPVPGPISPKAPALKEVREAMELVLDGRDCEPAIWNPFQGYCWQIRSRDPSGCPRIRGLVVACRSLDQSEQFWTNGVGCAVRERGSLTDGTRWLRLALRAPRPEWTLTIALLDSPGALERSYLDQRGFTCVALLSTGIARDSGRLCRFGGREPSDLFRLRVAGKHLSLLLLRGANDEIVELIETT